MSPGGFASIALARWHSAEIIEAHAIYTRHTIVGTSTTTTIDVLNTSRGVAKCVKQVHYARAPDRPTALSGIRQHRAPEPKGGRRLTTMLCWGGKQAAPRAGKNLTHTERFEAILDRELKDVRKRETERVEREVWW